ncbi:MAG: SDR family oxidoreductase [Anaerolineales bacterium]|nr:SDR family oxidoreductase [Anaerolineales bacterium]
MDKRTVLITGAAGGVGRAACELFAGQGWAVFGVDIQDPKPALPAGVEFSHVDAADPAQIEALAAALAPQLSGGLHALVNNAAVQLTKPLTETNPEEWDRVHAVNLRAPFLFTKALYSALQAARGAVVNVSSVHAEATSAEIGTYASTKGGLLALTRAMAIEFAPHGVRANAVLPGATDTPMLDAGLGRDHVAGGSLDERKADLADKILLKRLAAPAEIAQVIYFLADSERSSYITGQSIVADGGALVRLSSE